MMLDTIDKRHAEMERRIRRVKRRDFFDVVFKLTVATLCLSVAIGLGITFAEFLK